jgi:two-component system OmpR family sensor kinase
MLWLTDSRRGDAGSLPAADALARSTASAEFKNRADTVPDAPVSTEESGRREGRPWVPVITTLAASLATALALAWYVAKPIRSLRTAFDAVAGGDLDARVAPTIGSRHDELADLGRDFDRMADRLQESMNRQRHLLHNVSHEVRSPLARLQAAVGLLRLKHGAEEPVVERIEEEIVRIDSLVGGLLQLSRFETGELSGTAEDIDMQELVREVVADANFEAQSMGRLVTWGDETAGVVSGRASMLHGALDNVIRNALKYAPECIDIIVETSLSDSREHYLVRVLDTGPGVPQHELADVFTPFFRSAESAVTDGHGLGLAIARRAIEAHGGTISASNRRAGGLAVVMALPLKQQLPHARAG